MTPTQLRELIESKGLTVSAAARTLGLSKHTVFQWVYGKRKINKIVEFYVREKLKDVDNNNLTSNKIDINVHGNAQERVVTPTNAKQRE